jgi:C-terminal processing protease CtpA/Prc
VPGLEGIEIVRGLPGSDIGLGGDAPPLGVLADLTAWFDGDMFAPLPVATQVLAPVVREEGRPVFDLVLPSRPLGTPHTFVAGQQPGIQVFSINVHADLGGSPFIDPWEFSGWPTGYSSVELQVGTMAITGGSVLAWAEQDGLAFPIAPGPDGMPLTADDPVAPLERGWTRVMLDDDTYSRERATTVEVEVLSGQNGTRDLAGLSWLDAFEVLIAELRLRYPFTDHKAIDWEALVAIWRPEIEAATATSDPARYNRAMMRLAVEIGDGHLAATPDLGVLRAEIGHSTGFTIDRTTSGIIVIDAVAPGSPAAAAGLVPGTVITAWEGQLAAEALAAVQLWRPVSIEAASDRQRLTLLPLGRDARAVTLGVRGPGDDRPRVVRIARAPDDNAVLAFIGQSAETIAARADQPVESRMLDDRTGYVRVSTFAAAPALVVAGWDYAVNRLQQAGARELVVDLRGNPGGVLNVATYLAGSFVTQTVNLADLRMATDTGEFVSSGRLPLRPNNALWTGGVTVLVDSGCMSACEALAGALAVDPDIRILGHEGTAGVVATVAFWQMPGGTAVQAPLGRFEQGGAIWLEGTGVQPTETIPRTREAIISGDDPVLAAALESSR